MKFLKHSLINIRKNRFFLNIVQVLPFAFFIACLFYFAGGSKFFGWSHQSALKTPVSLNLHISARSEQGVPIAGAKVWANDTLLGATGSYGIWEGYARITIDNQNFVVKLEKGEGRKAIIKSQIVNFMGQKGYDGPIKISFLTPDRHSF